MGETYDDVINKLLDNKPKPRGGSMRPCVSLASKENAGEETKQEDGGDSK